MREREVKMVSEAALIGDMTTPAPEVVEAVRQLDGPILLLGVSGKMGPTLAELLVRAGARQVVGVARFGDAEKRRYLEERRCANHCLRPAGRRGAEGTARCTQRHFARWV